MRRAKGRSRSSETFSSPVSAIIARRLLVLQDEAVGGELLAVGLQPGEGAMAGLARHLVLAGEGRHGVQGPGDPQPDGQHYENARLFFSWFSPQSTTLDGGRMFVDRDDLGLVGRHAEKIGHRLDQFLVVQHGRDLQRPDGDILRQGEGAGLQLGLARPDAVVDALATWCSTAGWSSAPGDRNRACGRCGRRAGCRRAARP